jgi:hypothetical protein
MMEVCANGFAEHRRDYFISSGSASGVMIGWRALMRIPNGGGFSLDVRTMCGSRTGGWSLPCVMSD